MTIARYTELFDHPYWKYRVELLVKTNNKFIKIAEFNCRSEDELRFATDCCTYTIKGDKSC
jgi:hypothetical protein